MLPLWIALSAALAVEPPLLGPSPVVEPLPTTISEPIRLLYTGGSGGIGSGRYRFGLLDALEAQLPDAGISLDAVRPHHGAMAQGDWLLLASDRRVETLVRFLAAEEVLCDEPLPGTAVRTRNEVLLLEEAGALQLSTLLADRSAAIEVRACRSGEAKAWLAGPVGSGVPSDWSRFEFRLAMQLLATADGQPNLAELIGLPDEEATRRVAVLTDLRAAHPDALFVDGGSFVDGTSSVRDHALSLHRPTGFAVLRRLDPTALVPGRTELAGGAKALIEQARDLPYVATNWVTGDPALALPRSVRVEVDGVHVAFLGAVDPEVVGWVPQLMDEAVTIADPLAAALSEVEALSTSERPPDLVVLLTEIEGPELRRLQQRLTGVALVIGDTAPESDRVAAIDVTVRDSWAPDPAPAYTFPIDGIGLAELHLDEGRLATVRLAPQRVTPDLAPDLEVLRQVNAVRSAEYPPLDRALLSAPPNAPTKALPHATWAKVVCEAVLARTGADLALLPELPAGHAIPGPLTELLVVDRLAMLDVLEIHEVTGEALPRMLNKAFEVVPVACGAPLGDKAPVVAGRPVEPDRIYRVVTTDRIRTDAATEGLITEGRPTRLLDRPQQRPVLDADGAPMTLRRAVLGELRELREEEDDVVAVLAARSPADKPPQWVLRARPISFSIERFDGADDPAFAEIPETLATSPSSLTLSTNDDVQLEYSSRGLIWDARARATFTQLTTGGVATEPADDLKLSTSASLPGAAIPLTKTYRPMPYAEALYDSELTPIVIEEDGTVLPLQRDLSLTLGLSGSAGIFKTLRVGGFALRDLSVTEKPVEYGGRTEIYARVGFGPGLFWGNLVDAYLWAETPNADASDLRFKALLDSRLELPIAWWLDMAFYGRGFAFQGRVPETDRLGTSWTVGAALDFRGAFVL